MFIIIEGAVRQGKTYGATTCVVGNILLRNRNEATNWTIKGLTDDKAKNWRKYDLIDELYGVEHTDIWCDEATGQVGARDWDELPKRLRNDLLQHGKEDKHFIFIAQAYKDIDVLIRRQCSSTGGEVWTAKKIGRFSVYLKRPIVNAENGTIHGISGVRLFIRPSKSLELPHPFPSFFDCLDISKKIASMYDTKERVKTVQDRPELGQRTISEMRKNDYFSEKPETDKKRFTIKGVNFK